MKNTLIKNLIFAFVLVSCSFSFAQQVQDSSDFRAPAERIVVEPLYPIPLQSDDAPEVQVVVDFMVDAEGNVFEPTVVKSFNSELFEQSALDAVLDSEYRPATLNGEPIEGFGSRTFSFTFTPPATGGMGGGGMGGGGGGGAMGGAGAAPTAGATRAFNSRFEDFMESIASADPEESESLFDRLKDQGVSNLYESAFLGLASFRFAERFGSIVEQKHYMRAALTINPQAGARGAGGGGGMGAGGGAMGAGGAGMGAGAGAGGNSPYYIDPTIVQPFLERLISIELQTNDYAGATSSIETLLGIISSEQAQPYRNVLSQIEDIKSGDAAFAMAESLSNRGTRNLELFKSTFYFDQVQGSIEQIKLRCQQKFLSFTFNIENSYSIPSSYGICKMEIIGDPNTTFSLVQS